MTTSHFSFKDVDVYPQHFEFYEPGQWLDDVCINLAYRFMEGEIPAFDDEKCLLLDPTVVSFIRLQLDDQDEFDDLATSLRLEQRQWVFLPISDSQSFSSSGSHWSLLIWNYTRNAFYHADSCGSSNLSSAKSLVKKISKFTPTSTKIVQSLTVPQQHNGYDCGIYVVLFTQYMCMALASQHDEQEFASIKDALEDAAKVVNDDLALEFRRMMLSKMNALAHSKR